jgi:hypothetical protein
MLDLHHQSLCLLTQSSGRAPLIPLRDNWCINCETWNSTFLLAYPVPHRPVWSTISRSSPPPVPHLPQPANTLPLTPLGQAAPPMHPLGGETSGRVLGLELIPLRCNKVIGIIRRLLLLARHLLHPPRLLLRHSYPHQFRNGPSGMESPSGKQSTYPMGSGVGHAPTALGSANMAPHQAQTVEFGAGATSPITLHKRQMTTFIIRCRPIVHWINHLHLRLFARRLVFIV